MKNNIEKNFNGVNVSKFKDLYIVNNIPNRQRLAAIKIFISKNYKNYSLYSKKCKRRKNGKILIYKLYVQKKK